MMDNHLHKTSCCFKRDDVLRPNKKWPKWGGWNFFEKILGKRDQETWKATKKHINVARQTLQWLGWWLAFLWFSSVWKCQFSCSVENHGPTNRRVRSPFLIRIQVALSSCQRSIQTQTPGVLRWLVDLEVLPLMGNLILIAFSKLGRWLLLFGGMCSYMYMSNFWRVSDV